jgi:hypothetical protein
MKIVVVTKNKQHTHTTEAIVVEGLYTPFEPQIVRFADPAIQGMAKSRLDKDDKIDNFGGLHSTVLDLSQHREPTPPATPVEPEISLAEILRAIESVQGDIDFCIGHSNTSPEVRERLLRARGTLSGIGKNAPTHSHMKKKGVAASVEEVLSTPQNYSAEKIAEMRRLRAEVEAMVAEFVAVEKSRETAIDKKNQKVELLKKYGLEKWAGAVYGDFTAGTTFVKHHYKRWLDAGVFFRDDLRHMDSDLVRRIESEINRGHVLVDPVPVMAERTNREASGILSKSPERQAVARAVIAVRAPQREIDRFRRQKTRVTV